MLVACKECGKLIDSKESYCTICGAKRNKKKNIRPKFRPKETKSRDIIKETNAKFKKRGIILAPYFYVWTIWAVLLIFCWRAIYDICNFFN